MPDREEVQLGAGELRVAQYKERTDAVAIKGFQPGARLARLQEAHFNTDRPGRVLDRRQRGRVLNQAMALPSGSIRHLFPRGVKGPIALVAERWHRVETVRS